jgi:1,2-diacylglycerol 3-beta-glucosyltransferase
LLLFALAGKIVKPAKPEAVKGKPSYRIIVLIPAYKEDAVIVEVARQSLLQAYPESLYEVAIICDSLQQETITRLRELPVTLIEVQFSNSTKTKAINAALQQLPAYDLAVVLDADNVMDIHFLEKITQAFARGYTVVQGHRMAKNTNTGIALLDAVSEEINNHIFRKGHCALGLSAALIGSAMAFEYQYFKHIMATITAVSGFDKELELAILREGRYIYYAEDAFVYDEKVQHTADFRNQRTRWMAAQLKYLSAHFLSGFARLIKGNVDYFDKVVQFMLPPRVILLGLLLGMVVCSALLQHITLIITSGITLFLLMLTLYIAAPASLLKKLSWKAVYTIPVLFVQFLCAVWQVRKARYTFLHTPHGEVKQQQPD